MTKNPFQHGAHAEPTPLLPGAAWQTRTVTCVDVRKLSAGTEVAVATSNSHYHFVMLDEGGSRARVRGGRYVDGDAEARIEGSAIGEAGLWLGWIGVGLPMELSVQSKRLDTSPVRLIAISSVQRQSAPTCDV